MTKVDVIVLSTVFGTVTRLCIDLVPKRRERGEVYYVARIVDSSDPRVRGVGEVLLPVSEYYRIEKSRLNIVGVDGYPSIMRVLGKLMGAASCTWVCLGHFEVHDNVMLYYPEYSQDAVLAVLIDANLRMLTLYIPDSRNSEQLLFVVDSTLSAIPHVSYSYFLPVRTPMVLYSSREKLNWHDCVIARAQSVKPPIEVIIGTLVWEGTIGARHYVRFERAWTRDELQSMLMGYMLLRYFRPEELEKQIGITPRDLILGLEYWRQYAVRLEQAFTELRNELRRLGLHELENRVTAALQEAREWAKIIEHTGIALPYILTLPRLAHRLEEK